MNGVEFERPPLASRLALAMIFGLAGGLFAYWHITHIAPPAVIAYDFTWAWRGAQTLLDGFNPYVAIQPTGSYPFNSAFKYPLPLAVLALPTAHIAPQLAVAWFEGVTIAIFAFALTAGGVWRLPVLASAPSVATLILGQSSFIIAAAALLPSVAWMAFCVKPTSALVGFAYRPSRLAVIGTAVAYAVCLLIVPAWPIQWVKAMLFDPSTHWYRPAIGITGGGVLLLAALRWRAPEGRMLLAVALIPQNQAFYSGLIVLLVARTFRESLLLALLSWIGSIGWEWYDWHASAGDLVDPLHQAPWLLLFVYIPALIVVLRRPNAGRAPAWLERLVTPLPQALRGQPAPAGDAA